MYEFYVGDIHNHCGVSYGVGSAQDAFEFARSQLDFVSVTGHAWWHDIPTSDDPRVQASLAAHVDGFNRLAQNWDSFLELTNSCNRPGEFVTLASFEWHSITHGDRCVYYRDGNGPIIRANGLAELHAEISSLREAGIEVMAIPHHTAYGRNNRGLLWEELDTSIEPVVEIVSMHGAADLDVAERPYLLAIGPRGYGGSLQEGLRSGKEFGVIGSTDHHAAAPGSFGSGRIGVWATELTRPAIWEAIAARRVVALTGDRIAVSLQVDGHPMGSSCPYSPQRSLECVVDGSSPLERIDVLRDGVRWRSVSIDEDPSMSDSVISVRIGWGSPRSITHWELEIEVDGAVVDAVHPRFRGDAVVNPAQDQVPEKRAVPRWQRLSDNCIALTVATRGNQSSVQDDTQGLVLRVSGGREIGLHLRDRLSGNSFTVRSAELTAGATTWNPAGYLGPAVQVSRRIDASTCHRALHWVDDDDDGAAHNYLVRVRTVDEQWAWSSPVWLAARSNDSSTTRPDRFANERSAASRRVNSP